MIDPIILGYAFLAMLGIAGLQILFVIWRSHENRKWRRRQEVKP